MVFISHYQSSVRLFWMQMKSSNIVDISTVLHVFFELHENSPRDNSPADNSPKNWILFLKNTNLT